MIRAIIFDCFGVLYRSSADELYRRCPPERRDDLHDIRMQRDRGYIHYVEYIEQVAALLDMAPDELRRLAEQTHVRNDSLFDYIRTLDRSRYHVGLLSNIGDTTMDQLIGPKERRELFDEVILSYQVGLIKPDPRLFVLMAQRMGIASEDCVMIDDVERNCTSAASVGMNAIHYQSNDQALAELTRLLEASDA